MDQKKKVLLSTNGPFDLRHIPFSRRGCFLCVLEDDLDRNLYISLSRSPNMWMQRKNLIRLIPGPDGESSPLSYSVEAGKMTVFTKDGSTELCLDSGGALRIRTSGSSLRLVWEMLAEEYTLCLGADCYDAAFDIIGSLCIRSLSGRLSASEFPNDTGVPVSRMELCLDPDCHGSGEIIIMESRYGADHRMPEENFDQAVLNAESDFAAFTGRYTRMSDPMRQLAAWTVWNHTFRPGGNLKHPVVYMTRTQWLRAFGWQQSFHSMAVDADASAAFDLIATIFDYSDPAGQLPDSIGDIGSAYLVTKPALQGLALAVWMARYSFQDIPESRLLELYRGFCSFAGWWLQKRDRNHSGVPQYFHGDESPGEFCSCFRDGVPLYSGDLSAMLVLLTEGAGKMAEALGKADESVLWRQRSQRLLNHLVSEMWDGNQFVFRKADTGSVVQSGAFMALLPVILGHRLPEAVMDRLVQRLTDEKEYLLPGGISVENLIEEEKLETTPGPKGAMAYISTLVAIGLTDAGRTASALEIARRACRSIGKTGFTFMSFADPLQDSSPNRPVDRWSSWSASCYLILSDIILNAE